MEKIKNKNINFNNNNDNNNDNQLHNNNNNININKNQLIDNNYDDLEFQEIEETEENQGNQYIKKEENLIDFIPQRKKSISEKVKEKEKEEIIKPKKNFIIESKLFNILII
jgi:hypothetical protein